MISYTQGRNGPIPDTLEMAVRCNGVNDNQYHKLDKQRGE